MRASLCLALVAAFALANANDSGVVDLTAENFDELAGSGYWLVEFFAPWCGHCKKLAPVWDHIGTELKGKANIAKVDCTNQKDICAKFEVKGYPTIKLLQDGKEKEAYKGARTAAGFVDFLKKHAELSSDVSVSEPAGAAAQAPPKQEAKPEGPSDVVTLTDETYTATVGTGFWFVEYYAPWCGHCKKLAPIWEHLATELKGKANIAKVDCTVSAKTCGDNEVRGYPTVKLLKDGAEVERYQKARDLDAFVSYLKDKSVIDASVTVKSMGAAKAPAAAKKEAPKEDEKTNSVVLGADFAEKTETGAWFVKFYAPWCGHCKRLAPVWEELSLAYNNNSGVKIAKVDCTIHKEVCQQKGVSGYPTLKLFNGGAEVDSYRGGRDLAAFKTYLDGKGLAAAAAPAAPAAEAPAAGKEEL